MNSTCCSNNLTNCSQLHIPGLVYGMRTGAAVISLLCSLVGIFIILLFKKYLFLTQRLIMYLCIAVALWSLATVINISPQTYNSDDPSAQIFCSIAGFLSQYTYTALVFAITCITVDVFIVAVFDRKTTKLEPLYLLTTFFLPALFAWIPFIYNAYGEVDYLCWIRLKNQPPDCSLFKLGEVLQSILLFTPLLVALPLQVLLLLVTLCILYSQRYKYDHRFDAHSFEQRRSARKEIKKLILYPIIFNLFNIALVIHRIYTIINHGNYKFWLVLLAGIISPLQGAFITLVFVFDPETRKRLTWVQIRGALAEICSMKKTVQYYPFVIGTRSDSLVVQRKKQEEDKLKTEYELT